LAFVASGCGSAGSTTPVKNSPALSTSAPVAQSSTARAAAASPVAHLSILSPRTGAHTSSTLTVRVALRGARAGRTPRLRYVLDHRLIRSGSDRLTFHDLASGRHRLEVILPGASPSRASTTFIVRAPVRVHVAAPVATESQPAVSTPLPPPTSSNPAPSAPPPAKTTAPAPPKVSPPRSGGGIPQGPNAGDGDGDNNGGPSDGDGNI
jgi:hypothetical protein